MNSQYRTPNNRMAPIQPPHTWKTEIVKCCQLYPDAAALGFGDKIASKANKGGRKTSETFPRDQRQPAITMS